MKKVNAKFTVTLSSAAHVELESDTPVEIAESDVKGVLPVDPDVGIGKSVIFLMDGSSLNVLESLAEFEYG